MEYVEFVLIGLLVGGFFVLVAYCLQKYVGALSREVKGNLGIKERMQTRQRTVYINSLYDQIWSGDPADRPTAWFRVIQYLERNNYPEIWVREARINLTMETRKGKTSYKVTSSGRIINVDQIGGASELSIEN